VGGVPQRLHPRLRRLPGSVLLSAGTFKIVLFKWFICT
jgi:hypothetical protein